MILLLKKEDLKMFLWLHAKTLVSSTRTNNLHHYHNRACLKQPSTKQAIETFTKLCVHLYQLTAIMSRKTWQDYTDFNQAVQNT